jgi:hypothetical protein
VRLTFACARIDDEADDSSRGGRLRLRELVGEVLASRTELPLAQRSIFAVHATDFPGAS